MRPLSPGTYALLIRVQCPMLATPALTLADQLRAAAWWRCVHETLTIDELEDFHPADDTALLRRLRRAELEMDIADVPALFKVMTKQIERLSAAFVDAEAPGGGSGPLASTTPMSQTSESSLPGSGCVTATPRSPSAGIGPSGTC